MKVRKNLKWTQKNLTASLRANLGEYTFKFKSVSELANCSILIINRCEKWTSSAVPYRPISSVKLVLIYIFWVVLPYFTKLSITKLSEIIDNEYNRLEQELMHHSDDPEFELGNLQIIINSLDSFEKDLLLDYYFLILRWRDLEDTILFF